jgi:methyl-galactoside transport system ATP-binding protein
MPETSPEKTAPIASSQPKAGLANNYLLEMIDICKSFPGVKALDHAQLKVRPGSVHSLMGENGAGKSTLMKCLFGLYTRDSGDIIYNGRSVTYHSSKEALEDGIAMVQQELNQAQKMSVQDNLWLGRYPMRFRRDRRHQDV